MDEEAMEQEGDEGPSSEGQRREQQSRKYAKLKSKLRARIKTQKANRNKKRPGFSVKVATLKNNCKPMKYIIRHCPSNPS